MRMMMTVSMDTEKANEAVRSGKLMSTMQKIMADLKPEAAYFTADEKGRRTGHIFFDLAHASDIPKIAEPWFLSFNAELTIVPAMIPEDLAKAAADLEHAAKTY